MNKEKLLEEKAEYMLSVNEKISKIQEEIEGYPMTNDSFRRKEILRAYTYINSELEYLLNTMNRHKDTTMATLKINKELSKVYGENFSSFCSNWGYEIATIYINNISDITPAKQIMIENDFEIAGITQGSPLAVEFTNTGNLYVSILFLLLTETAKCKEKSVKVERNQTMVECEGGVMVSLDIIQNL